MTAHRLRFESASVRVGSFVLGTGSIAPAPGRVTVLLGLNGSGKTTALRAAAGLVHPAAGRVTLDGEDVCRLSAPRRASRIAFVPQHAQVGAPFTVREVVELGRVALPADPVRIDGALAAVGLAGLSSRPFATLSGGQRQRVAVARALAQHAPGGILLLDEAFAAVDLPEAAALVGLVRRVAAAGATVLAAVHDLSLAGALADDVWCLRAGTTAAFGPAADMLAPDSLRQLLGVEVREAPASAGRPVLAVDYGTTLPSRPS
jgi:iron complex transport system ATP-binding protein